MFKNLPLRHKLRISLIFVAFVSISLALGALLIFYNYNIVEDARAATAGKLDVASMFFRWRTEKTIFLCRTLVSDKALQVYADYGLGNKLQGLLAAESRDAERYDLHVFARDGSALASVLREGSRLAGDDALPKSPVLARAIRDGKEASGVEYDRGEPFIAVAAPLRRSSSLVGYVLARYELRGANEFVKEIADAIGADAFVYSGGEAVAGTAPGLLSRELYERLAAGRIEHYEATDVRKGGSLSRYRALVAEDGAVAGYLGVTVRADRYADMAANSLLLGAVVLVACMAMAFVLAELVTRSIVVPVRSLLEGVNRITAGDLSYEIMLDLRDEIGKLGQSFNQMRVALQEKIGTIEQINEGLESTVEQRTHTIEDLLNKMRKYLSPQLYDSIAGGSGTNDTKRHYRKKLTVFFSDVVNFTATSESLEAEDMSAILNSYLDSMAKIALKWGGTIDKFVGDAVMVFFGDPEFINDKAHATRAVGMALDMMKELDRLRAKWISEGFERPLHVRAGIATGYCTVGNFGSENKMDYTIIGPPVNLAARLEASAAPDTIFIAHETYSLVRDTYACEKLGTIELKGFSKPVEAFRVIGPRDAVAKPVENEYATIEGSHLTIKQRTVEPKTLTDAERHALEDTLKTALAYVRGDVAFRFDEDSGAWRMVRAKPVDHDGQAAAKAPAAPGGAHEPSGAEAGGERGR